MFLCLSMFKCCLVNQTDFFDLIGDVCFFLCFFFHFFQGVVSIEGFKDFLSTMAF